MISFEGLIDTLCCMQMGTVAVLLHYLTACTNVLTDFLGRFQLRPGKPSVDIIELSVAELLEPLRIVLSAF
jgi:hypothetical protein